MAQFTKMVKVELTTGAAPVVQLGRIFYSDVQAQRIGAIVTLEGQAAFLSGTCSGTAILNDGSTVPLTGTVSGNEAYIDLDSSCYAVEGPIQIFLKLTTGSVVTTLLAAVGTVSLTETGTVIDPGTVIPSVSALIASIENAVDSIPADYSGLLATIAPNYADLTFPVSAGQWCWYSGTLYAANQDIATSENWTAANWRAIVIGGEFASLKSAFNATIAPVDWTPTITSGSYFKTADGSTGSSNKYARTTALWYGYQNRIAVSLDSSIYECWVSYYDATGTTSGTGYLGCDSIISGLHYIPKNAVLFGLSFRRVDQENLSSSDIAAISAALKCYAPTDTMLTKKGMAADAKTTGDSIAALSHDIDNMGILPVNINAELTDGYRYTARSVGDTATPSSNASSKYTATAIDLSEYVGKKLKITRSANPSDNARAFGFVDANNKWVTVYDHRDVSYTQEEGLYTVIIPVDTGYFIYSDKTSVENIQFTIIQQTSESVCYVDTNGNDNYSGTLNAPFATVSHAIEKGFRNILVRGGVYEQRIALTLDGVISISPSQKTSIPIFVDPNRMKITSATLYADNIYKATTDFANLANTPIIFQDGYADTSTSISADERMPQQRGKTYRCDDTRIYKCSADNLADAITEMGAASEYKFFYDGTDLYFTAPSSDFSSYPICASSDTSLFSGLSRKRTLHVSGIECKYMRFDISNTMNSIIADCKCSCAYASALGQFVFDDAINPRFINCEAAMSHGANNGDGFNAHATNSGDAFSHQSGTILENCWSHDNSDDGYSEHAKGESFIIGGLYEYNGKGGVVPAYGSHCTCIGVISRHNYSGFLILGAANDQGIGGQLTCVSCVAYKNDRGGSSNTGYGFGCYGGSSSKPNTMTCVNCHSIDNASSAYRVGRTGTDTNNYQTLINCYESGGLHNHGYGTTSVLNGSLVEN